MNHPDLGVPNVQPITYTILNISKNVHSHICLRGIKIIPQFSCRALVKYLVYHGTNGASSYMLCEGTIIHKFDSASSVIAEEVCPKILRILANASIKISGTTT